MFQEYIFLTLLDAKTKALILKKKKSIFLNTGKPIYPDLLAHDIPATCPE